jgi:pimeloyl-ACP methyl ester carboxylesterase
MNTMPSVLLVPVVTGLEWAIAPQVAEWTEVATYDAPGVGAEPAPREYTRRAVAERGIAEIDRRGWGRCVVAGDEFGAVTASLLASLAPERVTGLALGHPSLSLDTEDDRPALNKEVLDAFLFMQRTNYHAYAHALSQVTQGAYPEDFTEQYIERVPQDVTLSYDVLYHAEADERPERTLSRIQAPLLLAEHRGCLLWTAESYRDIMAAHPGARTLRCTAKPSVSDEFALALREFCAELASERSVPARDAE